MTYTIPDPVPHSDACHGRQLHVHCGFSCQSVSKAHEHAKYFVGCTATGQGQTGVTYKGAKRYVSAHMPLIVFLENVGGLSKKDRERIIADFEAIIW